MFYNDYPNRKDRRRPYRDSRRFDASCRNHQNCSYCRGNRTYQYRRALEAAQQELKDYLEGSDLDELRHIRLQSSIYTEDQMIDFFHYIYI